MKKRVISLLLVFCMVTTLVPMDVLATELKTVQSDQSSASFTDVKEGDWCYDAVEYVKANGIFNGTSATTFDPNGNLTRGMFTAILGRMAGVDATKYGGDTGFVDVPTDKYYAPYIKWAAEYGITQGIGDGKFGPDAPINRQQMATLFVRYFKAFGVNYETGANITTKPADFDSIAAFAQGSVLELWRNGLLNGDGKNFDPNGSATRAQTATLCMRTDKAVETWYTEPGVPSDRVKVDPSTQTSEGETPTEEDKKPSSGSSSGGNSGGNSGGSSGGNTGGDYDQKTYYQVTFALGTTQGAGVDPSKVELPESKTYVAGTEVSALPVPYLQQGVFLGWYADAALTQVVLSTDQINSNRTLYAKMAMTTGLTEETNTLYATARDVETSYTFKVKADSEDAVRAALTILGVTDGNADIDYDVSSASAGLFTVTPKAIPGMESDDAHKTRLTGLEEGKTYKVTLEDSAAVYFVGQDESVRELTILTAKNEVQNLKLDDGIKYIPKSDVTGAPDFEGLFTVSLQSGTSAVAEGDAVVGSSGQTSIAQVNHTGTFTYAGSGIAVGDQVAIYEGVRPDQRAQTTENDGYIAYVEITGINGTTYSYRTSDSEDVMFTPDVLPVSTSKDSDGDPDNNSVTVGVSVMQFSGENYAKLGLDESTTIDVGDFMALYDGEDMTTATTSEYVKITGVVMSEENYVITYEPAELADVMAAMDLYSREAQDITMTVEEKDRLEGSIRTQAIESGFVDEAAAYLTALALETDGFQELAGDTDFDLQAYSIQNEDGSAVTEDQLSLMAGGKVTTATDVTVDISFGPGALSNLTDMDGQESDSGIRVELVMDLEITIGTGDNTFKIDMQAVFEQEVLLALTTSGGAVWEWAWIFPYVADYNLNASFEVGTYTGIGITATAYTAGKEDDEFKWEDVRKETDGVTGKPGAAKDKIINIGEQITDLMEKKDQFFNHRVKGDGDVDDATTVSGGLADKYASMLESADDSWIDIVRQEIFAQEGNVDPFHILVYGVSADFVVSANVHVTLGMTFSYMVAKQYNFSIKLFDKETTNEVVDLAKSQYNFDFYVMGTIGIRAGIEFEIAVGLFSLKLDSVGITAEAGVYAQMWGYFYYTCNYEKDREPDEFVSEYSGAVCMELGMYLEITFKAQLFSSDQLTWEPTIYENQWPFLTLGKTMNVYGFAPLAEEEADEEALLTFDLTGVNETSQTRELQLPSYIFDMNALDLQSGDNYDGNSTIMDGDEANCVNMDSDEPNKYSYDEEHFFMELSDTQHFLYNEENNTITVTPGNAAKLSAELKITWDAGSMAFTSDPIERVVTINWSASLDNMRIVQLHPQGGVLGKDENGVPVNFLSGVVNPNGGYCDPLVMPDDPTRQGYDFVGWGRVPDATYLFDIPDTFQYDWYKYGIDLYAKWEPKDDTPYIVEYYLEDLQGNYVKVTDEATLRSIDPNYGAWAGTTEASAAEDFYTGYNAAARNYPFNVPKGFGYVPAKSTDQQADLKINGNGKTTLQVYFIREKYTVRFFYGADPTGVDFKIPAKEQILKYGAPIVAPKLAIGGYAFVDFTPSVADTMPARDLEYTAKWEPGEVSYKVEHYVENEKGTFDLHSVAYGQGKTGTTVAENAILLLDLEELDYLTLSSITNSDNRVIKADGSLVIRCNYGRVTHNVTFQPGTEDAVTDMPTPQTEAVKHGAAVTAPVNEPLREGYQFAGWYNGETAWNFADPITGDVVLTAHWTANTNTKYTVEHYLQKVDGSGYDRHSQVDTRYDGTTGQTVDVTEYNVVMNLPGFAFAQANENNVLTGVVTADGKLVLKRYYDRIRYTVTFESNGGTSVDSVSAVFEAAVPAPAAAPTKTGYTFGGWYSNAELTGTAYPFGNAGATMPVNGFTLYAKWVPNTYTIKYNANGGSYISAPMADQIVTYSETEQVQLKANEYRYSGYDFAGWNTLANGTGTEYADQAMIDQLTTENGATVTLYAQWTAQKFGISFDADGGTYEGEPSRALEYGQAYGELPVPTKTGYTFIGWFNGDTQVSKDTTMGAEHVTLTAKWTVRTDIRYQVQHWQESLTQTAGDGRELHNAKFYELVDTDNLTGTAFMANVIPGAKTYTGFTVETMTAGATIPGVDDELVIKRYYDRNAYTVTFYPNTDSYSGPYHSTKTVKYGHPVEPSDAFSREGYTISRWENRDAGFTAWDFTTPVTGDLNLYAVWTEKGDIPYQIRYYYENFNGGYEEKVEDRFSGTGKTNASVEDTKAVPAGFSLNTSKSTSSGYIAADGSTVLQVYYDRNEYTVTFDEAGGSAVTDLTVKYQGLVQSLPAPTKTGYTFAGWYDAAGKGYSYIHEMPANDLTLTAKWTPITYYIEYISNGGTGSMDQVTVQYGQGETIAANGFTRPGYIFAGWNTAENGSGTAYAVGADASTLTTTGYSTIYLYAQWTRSQYTIRFNANSTDATGTMADMTVTHSKKVNLTLNTFTRTGHNFTGWNTKADGTGTTYTDGQEVQDLSPESGAVVDLYAQWEPISVSYQVVYSYQEVSGDFYGGTTEDRTGYYGEVVSVDTTPPAGFVLADGKDHNTSMTLTQNGQYLQVWFDRIKYTVTFMDGNTVEKTETVLYEGKAHAPIKGEKDGAEFYGWVDDNGDKWDKDAPVTKNMTLTARWMDSIPYGMKIYLQNANDDGYTIEEYQLGNGSVGDTVEMTEDHYHYYTKHGGYQYGYHHLYEMAHYSDLTLSADGDNFWNIYYDRNQWTLTLHLNNDEADEKVTFKWGQTMKRPEPTRSGYLFEGWYQNADLTREYSFNLPMSDDDLELYAKWERIQYTIEYLGNIGTNVPANQTVYLNETITLSTGIPTRNHYDFVCWNTEVDGNGTDYHPGQEVTNLTDTPNGYFYLYAQWKPTTYTVTFVLAEGESCETTSMEAQYNQEIGELPIPTKSGYTFLGWYRTDLTNWQLTADEKMTIDLTVYAKWSAN